jgi:hypothetical protein
MFRKYLSCKIIRLLVWGQLGYVVQQFVVLHDQNVSTWKFGKEKWRLNRQTLDMNQWRYRQYMRVGMSQNLRPTSHKYTGLAIASFGGAKIRCACMQEGLVLDVLDSTSQTLNSKISWILTIACFCYCGFTVPTLWGYSPSTAQDVITKLPWPFWVNCGQLHHWMFGTPNVVISNFQRISLPLNFSSILDFSVLPEVRRKVWDLVASL